SRLDLGLRPEPSFALDGIEDLVQLVTPAQDLFAAVPGAQLPGTQPRHGSFHPLDLARLLPGQALLPTGNRGAKDRVVLDRLLAGVRPLPGDHPPRAPDDALAVVVLRPSWIDPDSLGESRSMRSVTEPVPAIAE